MKNDERSHFVVELESEAMEHEIGLRVPRARQRALNTDHSSGKLLVGAVAVINLAVAISARSLSSGVLAVEILVGLLLVSNPWGLRAWLPSGLTSRLSRGN